MASLHPKITQAPVPMRFVGPLKLTSNNSQEPIAVPLATYETPLWHSVGRGARVSMLCEGIKTTVVDERMSRSILLEANDASEALYAWQSLQQQQVQLQNVVSQTSRFAILIDMHSQIVGNLLFIRLEFTTGDASGHNMVTQSAEHIINWILKEHTELKYCSISGNYCSDKKPPRLTVF